jgi:hypothetical protein
MTSQKTVEGGCLCGSIRFAISEPLAPAAYCLCSDCHKTTGSAFNISIPVALEKFASSGESMGGLTRFYVGSGVRACWEAALAFPSNQLLKKPFN